ncbi:MAG: ABC transporter substrate-binding protein [Bauldia sp.]|nr:ABC transporter substrate-binding protein [Bauldia sp.]
MTHIAPISRRSFLLSASALAALSALPRGAFAQDAPVAGGTLTFNVGAEPPVLFPLTNTGSAVNVGPKIVEGLLTYDFDFNPLPQLATEWRVSDDGLNYWFRIREGVKWHDGVDFTAEDVAFSILTLKEIHPRGRATFANVTAANVLGPHEAELVLSGPAPYLLSALAAMESPIIPKHIFEGTQVDTNPALSAPIGTGPFVFREWVRGSHIIVERNPDYWDEGKPYLDRIIFRFIGDASAAEAALLTREVLLSLGGVPLSQIDRVAAEGNLGVETRGYGYINAVLKAELNLDNPYLANIDVRHAIAHAIDKNFIVNTIYLGHARAIKGPVNPYLTGFFTDDLPTYEYDLARAEALLDQAGYPRGANGTRFALTIDPHIAVGEYRQTADYVAQQLQSIGIAATVRTQDWGAFVTRVYTDRAFDIAIVGISNTFDPSVGIQRLYWSENFRPGVPFSNGTHYSNPEADRLLEAVAVEIDPVRRRELFDAFQRIVVTDLPTIDLVAPDSFTLFSQRVVNHTIGVDGLASNAADIHLLPEG